ncbi:inorganic diphosphatase [Flavobacteriaceae bacterium 14752]|uniref:inorganic diphosphatase n=1 Tax=Mesohalobacter salilacus TaxID=2491711 RepID=UPI000F62E6A8|nr:inorganic diphosphatase [Flavobacteriaceae bacterium 14752]
MLKNKSALLIAILLLISCSSKSINYAELNSFDQNNNLQAVVEIPVGTNDKIEYNPLNNHFEQDTLKGAPRIIQFLGYPVNYGFIPSTVMNKNQDGDGDPLDALILGKPLKTGQIISVKPIGLLKMKDGGELDNKILGIPVHEKYQTLNIKNFKDLSQNHPKLREIIGEWFLNYDNTSKIEILGWTDEAMALKEVEKWQTSKANTGG